jgi:uncharacterized protein (DUF1697 family)
MKSEKVTYVGFLRGINVGGHHKVPMIELRNELEKLNLEKVVTILNSGNIIFDAFSDNLEKLENIISAHLDKVFGFSIPTILRKSEMIYSLYETKPFKEVILTKDIQLYVSFLRKNTETELQLPWSNYDGSYQIINKIDNAILSVVDISRTISTKEMKTLENLFGTDITTRNWNTIKRIENKLRTR